MAEVESIPYSPKVLSAEQSLEVLRSDLEIANTRRSIRMFADTPVPREAIETAIQIANTAPSGANRQPWFYVAISDPGLKSQLREQVEAAELEFYRNRATPEWLEAIAPLGTDFVKEHITDAPWVVILFRQDSLLLPDGTRKKNYYMTESVGISLGFFIQALHRAGLATLTHTPAPMTFLREFCGRPENEKPYVLLPVGYPAADCRVPKIKRKSLEEISRFP